MDRRTINGALSADGSAAVRRLAYVILLLMVVTAVQVLSWRLHARRRLAFELPAMIRYTFVDAEQRMRPHRTWPDHVSFVLARSTDPSLASRPERFQVALSPARIRIQTEVQARQAGILSTSRCRECVVVHYRELANNPLFARVQVSFSGGDHASAYVQTWVNVLGRWTHFRTQLSWMT